MNDTEPEPDWEEIARELLTIHFQRTSLDARTAFREAEDAVRSGELTSEDIRELRAQLNDARHFIENHLAPAAGCESWGQPYLPLSYGVLCENYGVKLENSSEQGPK